MITPQRCPVGKIYNTPENSHRISIAKIEQQAYTHATPQGYHPATARGWAGGESDPSW
ncbi:MAG: hypothetical protein Kow0063_36400 [Anaerolineae bacterium]